MQQSRMINPQRQVRKATTSMRLSRRWKMLGRQLTKIVRRPSPHGYAQTAGRRLARQPASGKPAKYEFRKYASRLVFALNLISIEIVSRPRVVAMHKIDRRSTALTRKAAQRVWIKRLDKTGDQVAALEAAVRETLAWEPTWSLNDAIRHAVAFVGP